MKSTLLFWIFFVLLALLIFPIYTQLWDIVFTGGSVIGNIAFIFIAVIVIIPLSAYLSEQLTRFCMRNGLVKGRAFYIFITILAIIIIFFFAFSNYNANRVKALDSLLPQDTNLVEYIRLNDSYEFTNKEEVTEIIDLLSNYEIKRMKEREWNKDVSKEHGFKMIIYQEDPVFSANIYKSRLHYFDEGTYYEIINGPVDFTPIEKLIKQID